MRKTIMSKKTLNEANLTALGAERLAQLLMEVSAGSALIKRRLRLELSHSLGPEELARDVRKRLTSIRRSTSYVGWRKRKSLIKDLSTQSAMITDKIAEGSPTLAFELLWEFIELAPSVYSRVDDSRGEIAEVFHAALAQFETIGPRAVIAPDTLAAQIWEVVRDNSFGEFDGVIAILAPTLGDAGLNHLKKLVLDYQGAPVVESDDHEALRFLRDLRSSGGNYQVDQKAKLIKTSLQQIATAQGDMDAYIAQYSAADLKSPKIAAQIANLMMSKGQNAESLEVLLNAEPKTSRPILREWDTAYIACLLALDRLEDAQDHRWSCFCRTLNSGMLRDYLKVLPDFDDLEHEEAAKAHAMEFGDATAALAFLMAWPDHRRAGALIEARVNALDGDQHEVLSAAAEALRDKHPLAAVLAWRCMINYVLWEGQRARYGAIVDMISECAAADIDGIDYNNRLTHAQYLDALRQQHGHKSSFWTKLPD